MHIYDLITSDFDIEVLAIDIGLNLLFNMGDIILEVKNIETAMS